MQMSFKIMSFKIPDPLYADIKTCSELEQRSINNWMRVHLDTWVARQLKILVAKQLKKEK